MRENQKELIVEQLKEYCSRMGSQNKAARSMRNVSPATISQMLNGKWELITDEMWRNVASQIGYKSEGWVVVPTTVYNYLYALFGDAQSDSGVHAIIAQAGSGKTETSKQYVSNNRRAYRLVCSEYWNRKTFMLELLEALGCDPSGYTVNEMMREVVRTLKSQEKPLLIIDEADKLSDQVLCFFITLYNQLEDCCGMILLATNHLEKRVLRGVSLNKKGYNEIYSRIGRRFVELGGNSYEDMANVCQANALNDAKIIEKIIDDSEGDLRRVKKVTRAQLKKLSNEA